MERKEGRISIADQDYTGDLNANHLNSLGTSSSGLHFSITNNSCQLDEEGNVLGEKIHPGTAVPPCPEEVLGRNLRTISLGGKKIRKRNDLKCRLGQITLLPLLISGPCPEEAFFVHFNPLRSYH